MVFKCGWFRLSLLPLVLVAGVFACSSGEEVSSPAPSAEERTFEPLENFEWISPVGLPRAHSYECGSGERLIAQPLPLEEEVVLSFRGETLRLPQMLSAPGLHYVEGNRSFVVEQDQVTLTLDGETFHCTENPERSLIETARLRGSDFLALGRRPEWRLRIDGSDMILFLEGEELHFPTLPPEVRETPPATIYETESEGRTLMVRIERSPCFLEDVEGEFLSTVELRLDEMVLTGCGESLK